MVQSEDIIKAWHISKEMEAPATIETVSFDKRWTDEQDLQEFVNLIKGYGFIPIEAYKTASGMCVVRTEDDFSISNFGVVFCGYIY